MATNEISNLESAQQVLDEKDPQGVNPSNAGGVNPTLSEVQGKLSAITDSVDEFSGPDNELSLPEVQEKLAGALAPDPADTLTELPLNQWLMRYQYSLPLLKQVIKQKIAKLPESNEKLQTTASDLRADQRANASTVLNKLFHKLARRGVTNEAVIQSALLRGLLMALEVRLDDKTIHSEEEARIDYDQFNITMVSRKMSLKDSSTFPEAEHVLRSQQNSTDIGSVPLRKPIGLLLYLNPDPQAPISTKEESTLQYMCSETKPFVIALTAK